MNKKSKFILKMILSGICGGIIGYSVSFLTRHQQIEFDITALYEPAYYVGAIIQLVFLVLAFTMYFKARKLVKEYSNDDDKLDIANKYVDLGYIAASVTTIVSFSFISLVSVLDGTVILLFFTLLFAFGMFLSIVVSSLLLGLIKVINPDKNVSYYDKDADKQLLKSMDEREKQVVGVASTSTIILMKKVFMYIMLVLLVVGFVCKELVVVNFFLGTVWLIQTMVYSYKVNKLERGNKDE